MTGAGSSLAARAAAWRDADPDPETRAELDRLLASGDTGALAQRFDGSLTTCIAFASFISTPPMTGSAMSLIRRTNTLRRRIQQMAHSNATVNAARLAISIYRCASPPAMDSTVAATISEIAEVGPTAS